MTRRVRPGDNLEITAVEYNRLLAAAEAMHRNRLPGGGGARTHLRNAATVRVQNTSGAVVPIGGIVGFNLPITDPEAGPVELARFVRDATINTILPTEQDHTGRVGVAIEPIRNNHVGRVVFAGVVAAQVDVRETWHRFADVAESGGNTLQSKPGGTAQILWRRSPQQTGQQWAVVRLGKTPTPVYLAKILPGGIPSRTAQVSGKASCQLCLLGDDGEIAPVQNADESAVVVDVFNTSRQRIRGPVSSDSEAIYRIVRYDQRDGWAIDPPTQTLLCRPTRRIRAKSWGRARELRLTSGRWQPSGNLIEVYNVCDMALLTTQHVVCHFHEDADAYLGVSARCCGESSSSSTSSFSDSFSSQSVAPSSSSESSASSDSSLSSQSASSSQSSSSQQSSSSASSSANSQSSQSSLGNSSSGHSSTSSQSSHSTSSESSDSNSESDSSNSGSPQPSFAPSNSGPSGSAGSHSGSIGSGSLSTSGSDPSDSGPSQSDLSHSHVSNASGTVGSEQESDKSTAIVPASFTPGGYTALFTLESPEVRFDDVFQVQTQPGRITTIAVDPRFVEVCQRGSLAVDSIVPAKPTACGATIDEDGLVRIELDREFASPVLLTVRVTGIRRGFAGKRFPNRTPQQFLANERFLQSAYPGAGR